MNIHNIQAVANYHMRGDRTQFLVQIWYQNDQMTTTMSNSRPKEQPVDNQTVVEYYNEEEEGIFTQQNKLIIYSTLWLFRNPN